MATQYKVSALLFEKDLCILYAQIHAGAFDLFITKLGISCSPYTKPHKTRLYLLCGRGIIKKEIAAQQREKSHFSAGGISTLPPTRVSTSTPTLITTEIYSPANQSPTSPNLRSIHGKSPNCLEKDPRRRFSVLILRHSWMCAKNIQKKMLQMQSADVNKKL